MTIPTMISSRAIRTLYSPSLYPLSTKAIDKNMCGLDPLFTDDNTIGGWKRREAKDRHAWPGKGLVADAPRLYDQQGNYRGKLSTNPYDPDSTSNPSGRYGSPFSPDSIKNPFGAGNPYNPSSPTNPYGHGLRIEGR
jgi:hypothetical protein